MNAAIAQHLNIAEAAIVRIEEWAHVLFVVAKGLGSRFVSKKVAKETKISATQLEAAGGSRWQKHGKNRVYFEIAEYVSLSNSKARKLGGAKLFFDVEAQKFFDTATVCRDEVKAAIAAIRAQISPVAVTHSHTDRCYLCGITVAGFHKMSGSLGTVCADCYGDENC